MICDYCKADIDEFENWHKCKECKKVYCETCSIDGEMMLENYDGTDICHSCILKKLRDVE